MSEKYIYTFIIFIEKILILISDIWMRLIVCRHFNGVIKVENVCDNSQGAIVGPDNNIAS